MALLASDESEVESEDEELMSISKEAVGGLEGPQTVRLQGVIQGKNILMLVDSGSSHSFISEGLARQLQGISLMQKSMRVKVANGGQMWCSLELPAGEWWVQRHQLCTNLKVLPLKCYDVILGMDWLEAHSPMEVHWKLKTLSFAEKRERIVVYGILPQLS